MIAPRVGASRQDNVIATLLMHGNGAHKLDLARIAKFQGFDEIDFRAAFARAETRASLTPNNCEIPEAE